jgi:5-methylthioadenosine/S-adenosylhomocysteine deaminase
MRPLARLHKLGVLNANVQLVHMTQIDARDIEILQDTGASVVHCPRSNLKLASGFCPIARLLEAGVNVALGTDGAASNNALDMFSEMQYAALLAKAVSKDAAAVSASQALRLATINGAKALGLDDVVGSIEVGKQADIAAVKFDDAALHPSSNPISTLVYTQSGHKVSDLWVAGRRILKDRQHLSLDINQVKASTQAWADKIK